MKRHLTRLQLGNVLSALLIMAVMVITACKHTVHVDPRWAAPTFTLMDSTGKSVALDNYRGKVVLLDFWATWCHGCKEEIPWFAGFQRKYAPKGLEVVGVSMDEDWKTVKQFLAATDVPYRIVLGNEAIAKQYGIQSMPEMFLIDREGRIAANYRGLLNKDAVEKNLQAILSR